jgi:DNA-directed RNA polymerase specialized sigma24 family protein
MNNEKKSNINGMVASYINQKDDGDLSACYGEIFAEYRNKIDHWAATTYLATSHEMLAIFDDTFIKSVGYIEKNGGDFVKLFHRSLHNRYKSLLRKLRLRRANEMYETKTENDDDTVAATIENIAAEQTVEDVAFAKRKADQRQLIDSFLSDADELTTAIVKAFLEHPKPTPTAIGKQLGIHHSTIIRKLERLAGKFDSKKHGDYRDFLVAM